MMAAGGTHEKNRAVEELLEEALVDAYGDDEQLWALRQAFEDDLKLPADAFIIGEPVSIVEFDYDGHERRGLTAKCRRDDGSEHVVSASDVVFPEGLAGELHVAAYRMSLGLSPFAAARSGRRAHKATAEDLDLSGRVELAVLSVMQRAARCRLLDSNRVVTLRASGLWEVVPGHIVTIRPRKQWRYGQHPYLSGEIESSRIDVRSLGLDPLRLESQGLWDPEMEQVLPGADPNDPDSDPITESNDLRAAEDLPGARTILMNLCQSDLRNDSADVAGFNLWPDLALVDLGAPTGMFLFVVPRFRLPHAQ